MTVKIRLMRGGRIRKPFYKIVVANAVSPRDGKALDFIGHYDPMMDLAKSEAKTKFNMDFEKLAYWLSTGAQPTDRIKLFIVQSENNLVSEFAERYKKELEVRKTASIKGHKREKKKKK
jgi:small subunit ribosomal protein S16